VIAFTRHGQTAVNREGRMQGRLDAALSELGASQAAALGVAFSTEKVTRVLSSPLQRAHATAAAVASHHGLAVEIDERLIELDYGDWDGLPLHEVGAESWAAWQRDVAFTPPGGESLEDVARRVAGFMESELDDAPTVTVAVSHVSPIKAAVCDALEVGIEVSWRMQLGVASITRIAGRDGRGVLLSYNATSHLTPT